MREGGSPDTEEKEHPNPLHEKGQSLEAAYPGTAFFLFLCEKHGHGTVSSENASFNSSYERIRLGKSLMGVVMITSSS